MKRQQRKPSQKQEPRRGNRVEISAEKCAGNRRWHYKEIENLTVALGLAVNPKSQSDWNKIADAVSKGCLKKRTGEECRARAEKDGLFPMCSQAGAANSSFIDEIFQTHPKPKRLAAKQKRSISAPEFDEIHSKYYDDFFAKQESPLDTSLDLNDSLVRGCFAPPPTYSRLKRARNHPFVLPLADHSSTGADGEDECDDNG